MDQPLRATAVALSVALAGLACGPSPASSRSGAPADAATEAAAPTPVGSSAGGCECQSDSQCLERAQMNVAFAQQPEARSRRHVGSQCVARDRQSYWRPTACLCRFAAGTDETGGRYELTEVLGNRPTCDVWGRATGCLFRACEFPGCDPASPGSCDGLCQDLAARIAADDAKAFDAQVRSAHCERPSCLCRSVYRVGGQCYGHLGYEPKAYDCALSDEDIAAAESPAAGAATGQPATPFDQDAGPPPCDY